MNKRVVACVIITICVILSIINPSKHFSSNKEEQMVVIPVTPLNFRLNNEMSAFENTEVFDREVEAFMRKWELKGASFALMRNDSLLYAKGYGYSNDTTKCDVHNVFRVASVSKLITATAVMRLMEQNKLSLDSQVFGAEGILCDSMFLNLYSKSLEQITVNHLLRHTAGFSSPVGDPAFSCEAVAKVMSKPLPLSVDDMVQYATRNRLKTRPGDHYDYSNLGYIVLGKIVETVSGMDYETYLQDSVLSVAGCYDMFVGQNFSRNREANEVQYYEVKEAKPVEAYDGSGVLTMKSNGGNNVNMLQGAGGWVASPVELLKLVSSIDGCQVKNNILQKTTIDTMTYSTEECRPIGWASSKEDVWLRSGYMSGTSALIKRQDDGYTWVFLTNNSAWVGSTLSKYISTHISNALNQVDQWPERDMFEM